MGYSIYIAEDDKKIRELIHRFLESDGYAVTSFENGDELLTAFRKNPADLVILDIMMPGTDGLEICSRLREFTDVPIILLTAKDSELDYVSGITQGSACKNKCFFMLLFYHAGFSQGNSLFIETSSSFRYCPPEV